MATDDPMASVDSMNRRLLGFLRDADTSPVTAQASLDRLGELVTEVTGLGLRIDFTETGPPRPLPPGLDQAAYRIVQEALTNTVKHAGASRATVALEWEPAAIDLDEYVWAGMKAGASGFLLKDVDPPDLCAAVRGVARGDMLLSPTLTRRLIEHFLNRPAPGEALARATAGLTERELDVLRLIARGRSNAEIGAELYLAEPTVKTHVTRMLARLGLRGRVQAVVFAYESGLIEPGRA